MVRLIPCAAALSSVRAPRKPCCCSFIRAFLGNLRKEGENRGVRLLRSMINLRSGTRLEIARNSPIICAKPQCDMATLAYGKDLNEFVAPNKPTCGTYRPPKILLFLSSDLLGLFPS
jgi:hypothetical protein